MKRMHPLLHPLPAAATALVMPPRLALLLGAAAAALVGCAGEKSPTSGEAGALSSGAPRTKIFSYVNVDEPAHLDPAFSSSYYDGLASGLLFDGLVAFGKGTEIIPGLAERWEVDAAKRKYTFYLRPAKFSTGAPVTSADVRYSITRILLPETNSDRKWLFDRVIGAQAVISSKTRELAGVTTPDARTVVIELSKPYVAFLTKLAMPGAAIIPAGAGGAEGKLNKKFDTQPIGSGPWVLDNWRRDERLVFARNPHFWGDPPKIDKLAYYVQSEDTAQRQVFLAGKLDIYPQVGATVYGAWRKDALYKDRMLPVPELNIYYMGITATKPALKDKRVRQAISHAVNVQSIFENIQISRGELSHGPVPPGIEGYRPAVKPRSHDVALAKRLLAEAGATNLKLDLWLRTEPTNDQIAEQVKDDLGKAGIQVTLIKRDHAAVKEATYAGTPDLFLWSWWLDYPDIENALVPCYHSKNIPRQGNRSHYRNAEVDRLLDAADVEPDASKRLRMFQQVEDLVIDDCPWVFLYHRKSFAIVQPWVRNFEPALMFNANRYTEVDIDLEAKGR